LKESRCSARAGTYSIQLRRSLLYLNINAHAHPAQRVRSAPEAVKRLPRSRRNSTDDCNWEDSQRISVEPGLLALRISRPTVAPHLRLPQAAVTHSSIMSPTTHHDSLSLISLSSLGLSKLTPSRRARTFGSSGPLDQGGRAVPLQANMIR
jgi:hypothetical protein